MPWPSVGWWALMGGLAIGYASTYPAPPDAVQARDWLVWLLLGYALGRR